MQEVKMSELESKQKIIAMLAKHWTLIMALVSIFWIAQLIDYYNDQIETHEDMKETKIRLETSRTQKPSMPRVASRKKPSRNDITSVARNATITGISGIGGKKLRQRKNISPKGVAAIAK